MDETNGSLFSYFDLEVRIPARHPLRRIRQVVNGALASLDAEFEALYTDFGRPSIPPERLIRASLLQIPFWRLAPPVGWVSVYPEITPPSNFYHFRDTTVLSERNHFVAVIAEHGLAEKTT